MNLNNILDLLIIASCLATCLRLLLYRRQGSNFKRGISVVAYVLIVITGAVGLLVLMGKMTSADINPVFIFCLFVLMLLVYRAQGNVAQLIRNTLSLGDY
jgi:drug/metabolite transporter (DMT)-like permease